MHFDKVLEQLTKQTGVQFIYSSSIVPSDRPVTVTVEKLSLNHVLALVGSQAGVSFKRKGNYYVVKRNSPSNQPAGSSAPAAQPTVYEADAEGDTEADNASFEEAMPASNQRFRITAIDTDLKISENSLTKDLFHFGPGLAGWDTTMILKHLPLFLDKQSLSLYKKNWFASLGLTVNDYSVGIEAQAGLPALYTVVNGSLLNNGIFRFGYGLGTSVAVKPGLAANLTYTFATLRRSESDAFQNIYKSTGQHHQIRLMAHIILSRHLSLRVGPSFNILNTNHYFQEGPPTIVIIRYRSFTPNNSISSTSYAQPATYPDPKTTVEYRSSKTWASFEAAFSYRINFSLRK
ncbi:MAG: hypothetical protein C0490_05085 [Marivirga sp.]|nr:hypothetical protein [Marivirga sp.]